MGVLAALWTLCVDGLTKFNFGSQSLSGLATLGSALILVALFPSVVPSVRAYLARPSWRYTGAPALLPMSLLGFLVYAVIRLISAPNPAGLQNVCVYAAFVLTIAITAVSAEQRDRERWSLILAACSGIATVVFLVQRAAGLDIIGDRSYALSAIIFMAISVPRRWPTWVRYLPYLVLIATVLSLSRTATLICLLAYVFIVVRGPKSKRVGRILFMLILMAMAAVGLFLWYPPFRDRFFSGDNAVSLGGTTLNTSGRTQLWDVTWNSAMESPLLGHGPGTASDLIDAHFANIGHPHNEYLRLFHDFGILGELLWVVGIVALLRILTARATKFDRSVDWTGLIATIGISLASITDNVIIYPFVMLPAGMAIGLALSRTGREQALSKNNWLYHPSARLDSFGHDASEQARLTDSRDEMEINEYLVVLRRRWQYVLAPVLIGMLIAGLLTSVLPREYRASTQVLFSVQGARSVGDMNDASAYLKAQVPTYVGLATAPLVLDPVIKSLNLDTTPEQLAKRVTVTQEPETVIVTITTKAGSAAEAAGIARGIGDNLSRQVAGPSAGTSNTVKVVPQVISPAVEPASPSAPSLPLDLALGAAIGFFLGMVLAVLVESNWRRKQRLKPATRTAQANQR